MHPLDLREASSEVTGKPLEDNVAALTPLLIGHCRSLPAQSWRWKVSPQFPRKQWGRFHTTAVFLLSSPNPSSSYKRTSRCCKSSRLAPRFPFCNAPLQYDVKAPLLIWRIMSPRLPWSVMAGPFYNNVRPLVFSRGKCTCRMDGCTCGRTRDPATRCVTREFASILCHAASSDHVRCFGVLLQEWLGKEFVHMLMQHRGSHLSLSSRWTQRMNSGYWLY